MKMLDNIRSKVEGKFPVIKRPTPILSVVAGHTGQSKQFGEFLAAGAMLGGKHLLKGAEGGVTQGIRDRISGAGRHAEKGKSEYEGVGLRQRIVERASGCSCRCGK